MKLFWKMLFNMKRRVDTLKEDEAGQAFSEYAIIIGVIAIVVIAVLIIFKDAIIGLFNRIIDALDGVGV